MKLYCFVILVFISVIFTVGEGEWGIGGVKRVKSSPIPSTNQNEANLNSYSQPPLTKRLLNSVYTDIQLKRNIPEERQEHDVAEPVTTATATTKHPSQNQTNTNNQSKSTGNNKGKDNSHAQNQNDPDYKANTDTAKKLEEEAQTINRVIVVLGSLGASLLLVAVAIAVLYWKVRKQQKEQKQQLSQSKGLSNGGENTCGNTNDGDDDNIGNGNGKRDDGVGVGNGETSMNMSDGSESLFTTPLINDEMNEKLNIINNSNGINNEVVGEIDNNEVLESRYIQIHNIQQSSPRPTAPPKGEIEVDNDNISDSSFSAPPLIAPPAYTPTAPPIYALPHMPIDGSMILCTDGNTYQFSQQNSHNLETDNDATFTRTSPLHPPVATSVWYAAGPTSQTNTSTNDAQQSNHSTIIQTNLYSTTNLNSSSNLNENNDDNNRSTNQRLTI